MAILSVTEISSGRSMSLDANGQRNYTRSFRVLTDNPLDGQLQALLAPGIPLRGDSYVTATEFDTFARVKNKEATQDGDNRQLWIVRCDYDTLPFDDDNPFNRPIEYSWSFAQFSKVADRTIDGFPITNSAGQFFDPPPEMDDSRPVLTVTKNVPFFAYDVAIAYQDAVNSDWFIGFAPGRAKVFNISGTSTTENINGVDWFYWRATVEIHFRREGWTLQLLDQGRYELVNDPQTGLPYSPCRDRLGQPLADPALLNGQGRMQLFPSPFTAVYSNYRVYKELPFTGILF